MTKTEFLKRMDITREDIRPYIDYSGITQWGLCVALDKSGLWDAVLIMRDIYEDRLCGAYYWDRDTEKGHSERIIGLCLLEEYILSERLYKKW